MSDPFAAPGTDPAPPHVGLRRLAGWQGVFGAAAVIAGGLRLGQQLTELARLHPLQQPLDDAVGTFGIHAISLSSCTALLAVGAMALATAAYTTRLDLTVPADVVRGLAAQRRLWMVIAMASVATLGTWLGATTLLSATGLL